MVYQPTEQVTEREALIQAITESTEGAVSSFDEGDFEFEHAEAVSQIKHELGHYLLASWFATWIDYAGKELDADDIRAVGLNPDIVDFTLLNAYVEERDLDRLVADTTDRIPAKRAEGEIRFILRAERSTDAIPDRTRVETQDGFAFYTTREAAIPPGTTSVTVPIEAAVGGVDGNVRAGAVSILPSNQPGTGGIQQQFNPEATAGGEPQETTPELRQRARQSRTLTAGGVTVAGEKGRVIAELPDSGLELDDIAILEFPDPTVADAHPDYNGSNPDLPPAVPHAIVVVDGGGTDEEVEAAISVAKEHAIAHPLVRPDRFKLDIEGVLRPTEFASQDDIKTDRAEGAVLRWLSEKSLGDNVSIERLGAEAIYSDPDTIEDLDSLTVTDQDGNAITDDLSVSLREVADPASVTFTAGTREV